LERLSKFLDAAERPLLVGAAIAVGLYLGELAGLWASLGVEGPVGVLAAAFDAIFVLDLFLRMLAGRLDYLRTPWFVIDLVCALPALTTLGGPRLLEGLRFVRMFRLLRALRLLRSLRVLRVLRAFEYAGETRESRTFDRVLRFAVLGYAALFVGLLLVARGDGTSGVIVAVEGRPIGETLTLTMQGAKGTRDLVVYPDALAHNGDKVELWFVFGSLLGMALLLVVSQYQIPAVFSKQVRALLNVALPRQVAEWFLTHPDSYDRDVRMPATVVFCDITGFTAASEGLALEELKRHLEKALDCVVEAHLGHDLIVDKFIGDAVMSFRGGNLVDGTPEDHAYRVVRGALEGAMAIERMNDPYFKAVKLGGSSGSSLLIGTFGTSKRLSYTILGDRVNLASRLEGACGALGVRSLFCGETRRLCGDRGDLVWRRVGRLTVSGKLEHVAAFEVFDSGEDTTWLPAFDAALSAWEAGRFDEAAAGFAAVDAARPGGDGLSRTYRKRLPVQPVPADWSPVLETRK
jgi:class 3 adenylate cyclase